MDHFLPPPPCFNGWILVLIICATLLIGLFLLYSYKKSVLKSQDKEREDKRKWEVEDRERQRAWEKEDKLLKRQWEVEDREAKNKGDEKK